VCMRACVCVVHACMRGACVFAMVACLLTVVTIYRLYHIILYVIELVRSNSNLAS